MKKRTIFSAVMLFATTMMLSGCIFPHWGNGHGHGRGHGDDRSYVKRGGGGGGGRH